MPPKDHQQQDEHHRHGQQLGPAQVGGDLALELAVLEGAAADQDMRGVEPPQLGLSRLEGPVEPGLAQPVFELDRHQGGPAVAGQQLGRSVERVGDLVDAGDGPQPLGGGPDAVRHPRVARVDAVGDGGDGLAPRVESAQPDVGPDGLGPFDVADVGVEAIEDAAPDGDAAHEQDHPGGGDQAAVAKAEAGEAAEHGALLRGRSGCRRPDATGPPPAPGSPAPANLAVPRPSEAEAASGPPEGAAAVSPAARVRAGSMPMAGRPGPGPGPGG
jgi:hypothetical protein